MDSYNDIYNELVTNEEVIKFERIEKEDGSAELVEICEENDNLDAEVATESYYDTEFRL